MSDPVSNAEIEDVLSSIRQLISDGQTDKADGAGAHGVADNKLILTPAFRVYDGDSAGEAKHNHPRDGRDIPVEKFEHGNPDTGPQADDPDKPLGHLSGTFVGTDDVKSGSKTSVVSNDPPIDYEDNWDDDSVGETAQVAFLHQRLVRTEDEKTPDDSLAVVQDDHDLASPEGLAGDKATDAVSAVVSEDPNTSEDASYMADQENDLDASGETVMADTDIAFDETEDAEDLTALDAEEVLHTETIAAESVSVLAPETAPQAEIVDDDSDFIDEAHLQDMISRIVREELQGQMGVKITQAVRRMVRREVTRALSIEKFD